MIPEKTAPALGDTRTAIVVQRGAVAQADSEDGSRWEADLHESVCEHCLEDGHDEERFEVEFANGQRRGAYRVTYCAGGLWLCDAHILEAASAQGISARAVVFADEKGRSGHWDRLGLAPIGGVMKATRRTGSEGQFADDAASVG